MEEQNENCCQKNDSTRAIIVLMGLQLRIIDVTSSMSLSDMCRSIKSLIFSNSAMKIVQSPMPFTQFWVSNQGPVIKSIVKKPPSEKCDGTSYRQAEKHLCQNTLFFT